MEDLNLVDEFTIIIEDYAKLKSDLYAAQQALLAATHFISNILHDEAPVINSFLRPLMILESIMIFPWNYKSPL